MGIKYINEIQDLLNASANASWYLQHFFDCEVETTDFCTCGMNNAKEQLIKAYEKCRTLVKF